MNLSFCEPPTYIPNIKNHELFLMAYRKWTSVDRNCRCGHGVHGSALITPARSSIYELQNYLAPEVCERHKAWIIYVKARENVTLTNEEKAYLGLM